ncbi:hypothetical protein F4779DRAFT_614507 [Xylariaceae sp. FL0662B]|nr:hypothetical protein F4779DRAFT_614507 [Xylariaceae sp. FL0662B]
MVTTTPQSIRAWKPESAADLAHFRSVPWLADVIDRPGVRAYQMESPVRPNPGDPPGRAGVDPVLDGTLAGVDAVRRHVTLLAGTPEAAPRVASAGAAVKRGDLWCSGLSLRGSSAGAGAGTDDDNRTGDNSNKRGGPGEKAQRQQEKGEEKGEENAFPTHLDVVTLGAALSGVPRTLHGGVMTLLLDAVCGRVGYMHRDPRGQVYTAYTNVTFARPLIYGPDADAAVTVLVRARVCETRGPRMVVRASVEGEGGRVYAVAESAVVEKYSLPDITHVPSQQIARRTTAANWPADVCVPGYPRIKKLLSRVDDLEEHRESYTCNTIEGSPM